MLSLMPTAPCAIFDASFTKHAHGAHMQNLLTRDTFSHPTQIHVRLCTVPKRHPPGKLLSARRTKGTRLAIELRHEFPEGCSCQRDFLPIRCRIVRGILNVQEDSVANYLEHISGLSMSKLLESHRLRSRIKQFRPGRLWNP